MSIIKSIKTNATEAINGGRVVTTITAEFMLKKSVSLGGKTSKDHPFDYMKARAALIASLAEDIRNMVIQDIHLEQIHAKTVDDIYKLTKEMSDKYGKPEG